MAGCLPHSEARGLQRERRAEPDVVAGGRRRRHETQLSTRTTARRILVGHSYGGAVITEAGTHAKVVGLVVHRRVRARATASPSNTLIAESRRPARRCRRSCRRRTATCSSTRPSSPPSFAGRRRPGQGRVHGRLAGAVGRRGARRHDQQGVGLACWRHREVRPESSMRFPTRRPTCSSLESMRTQGMSWSSSSTRMGERVLGPSA